MTSGTLLSLDRSDFFAGVFGGSNCSGGGILDTSFSCGCGCETFAMISDDSTGSSSRNCACDMIAVLSDISRRLGMPIGCANDCNCEVAGVGCMAACLVFACES
jgi:hypothetical protein